MTPTLIATNPFENPVLNAAGQVAFVAFVNLTGLSNQGVFVEAPGAIQAAALEGDFAPTIYGGFYSSNFQGNT